MLFKSKIKLREPKTPKTISNKKLKIHDDDDSGDAVNLFAVEAVKNRDQILASGFAVTCDDGEGLPTSPLSSGGNNRFRTVMEGWLWKRNSSRRTDRFVRRWSRRWFMLDEDTLWYVRGGVRAGTDDEESPHDEALPLKVERKKVCHMMLCTVREPRSANSPDPSTRTDRRFEVITSSGSAISLRARGREEYVVWVENLRACIVNLLSNRDPDEGVVGDRAMGESGSHRHDDDADDQSFSSFSDVSSGCSSSVFSDSSYTTHGSVSVRVYKKKIETSTLLQRSLKAMNDSLLNRRNGLERVEDLMETILRKNRRCADCGAPDPDWVSINLGVVVCIGCSGVHRSLGSHLSKIRSLKLDKISPPEAHLVLALGNDSINSFRESTQVKRDAPLPKPSPDSAGSCKEAWIKYKYVPRAPQKTKKGGANSYDLSDGLLSYALFEAARACDLLRIAECLSEGADVSTKDDNGETALHACLLCDDEVDSRTRIDCAELLLLNGASITETDANGETVVERVNKSMTAEEKVLDYLSSKMTRINRSGYLNGTTH